ncbi:MAG: TonB-dependent receptor, partial [Alphaproteobacteria bacterium]|nr:TonB-dependent receptor [Alphaproteobacteria bacterium]
SGVADLLANTNATSARFFMNGIDTRTRGVDVVLSYDMDMGDLGSLNLNAGFNYNDTDVTDIIDPPAVLADAGVEQDNLFATNEFTRFEKGSPKTKLNLGATWTLDALRVTARTTRYGETWDPSSDPTRNEIIPAAWVSDLDINYDFNETVSLGFGANNIFDVYPSTTRELLANPTTFDNIFPYSGFSPLGFSGRFVYARLEVRF